MPALNWIGKDSVANHHQRVPFHLLTHLADLSCGNDDIGNLIVEGDNLVALKALLPYYAGRVKCIYIDPPYNTGKENEGNGWLFNDKMGSPVVREWLGKTVGREADDLSRHDKWLCMMYPRLQLLKQFLAPDGVLFVSIDDIELAHLRILLDELFPHAQAKNRLACFVWETDGNFDNQAKIKISHEYVLAYSRNFESFPPPPVIDRSIDKKSKLFRKEIRNTIVKNGPRNPVSSIVLPAGFPADFDEGTIRARSKKWPHYAEDVIVQDGRLVNSVSARSGWSSKDICESFIQQGCQPVSDSKGQLTRFVLTRTGNIENVKVRSSSQSHVVSVIRDVGSTQSTSEELAKMGIRFTFPKPVSLISYLVSMVSDKNALVLDSFAGSGTTAHAVMDLNIADGGNRRYILVQLPFESETQQNEDLNLCREITARRVRAVCEGYEQDGVAIEGLGGGFKYCRLDEPLFDLDGTIRSTVSFAALARHVFFAETGQPLAEDATPDSPLLGVLDGVAVYLLFNGILGDRSAQGGNVLTRSILAQLPQHAGPKVIYCAGCLIGRERLQTEQIVVRQTPYEIRSS